MHFQFEDVEDESEREMSKKREAVLVAEEKKKNRVVAAASSPEFESSLADPVLKEIATSAARNIISAAR